MKLLIAGSDFIWSLENHYAKHLAAAGASVGIMPVQSIFYKYYNKGIAHKIFYKLGLSGIEGLIDKLLRKAIAEQRPDVLWVFKGMEIRPSLLQWAREGGVRLVNYNPDNPFLFSGSGSGNRNIGRSIGLYDLHFTYDRDIRARIESEYGIPCRILPFGFEDNKTLFETCREQEEALKVCFLGNPDAERSRFIGQLADELPIDVYGYGWDKFLSHPNVKRFPAVYGDDFWKTLYRYRVQLNLMRPHNPDSHNMRSFEIPGVGGIGLFPRTPDHRHYFTEQAEVFLFDDPDECKKQASRLLHMSKAEAEKIRLAARAKSLDAGYTYHDRARQALLEMETLA